MIFIFVLIQILTHAVSDESKIVFIFKYKNNPAYR